MARMGNCGNYTSVLAFSQGSWGDLQCPIGLLNVGNDKNRLCNPQSNLGFPTVTGCIVLVMGVTHSTVPPAEDDDEIQANPPLKLETPYQGYR